MEIFEQNSVALVEFADCWWSLPGRSLKKSQKKLESGYEVGSLQISYCFVFTCFLVQIPFAFFTISRLEDSFCTIDHSNLSV
jgi:hypothetical protein